MFKLWFNSIKSVCYEQANYFELICDKIWFLAPDRWHSFAIRWTLKNTCSLSYGGNSFSSSFIFLKKLNVHSYFKRSIKTLNFIWCISFSIKFFWMEKVTSIKYFEWKSDAGTTTISLVQPLNHHVIALIPLRAFFVYRIIMINKHNKVNEK